MERSAAEKILKTRFGIEHFYDEQWKAISKLMSGNHRILMIEKTGFGKSLCYQFPAIIFPGVTIVFSPLIALMRDQVNGLQKKGIPAGCINSGQKPDENAEALTKAERNQIKILYITPERQENREWIQSIIESRIRISMVVIDEAHTISVWGHDFRPAFRKIVNLIRQIGTNTPILATTATATLRVQEDIREQIGQNIEVIRGNLMRENFRLYVIQTKSEEEKMTWLKNNILSLEGTGIIYAGTKIQSETYAEWLSWLGISCTWYNSGLDSDSRKEIEDGLMKNRWKCVISTNALGMGIDKADIRFIIHLQIPVSPIHYYQEIGRAGRDGKPTSVILLYNSAIMEDGTEADTRLPRAFIDSAKPAKEKYMKVLTAIRTAEEPPGEKAIMLECNLKRTEFRIIKDDLIDQKMVREVRFGSSRKLEAVPAAGEIDFSSFSELRAAKLKDLDAMTEYVHTDKPRMKFLCEFLGDRNDYAERNCDNTTLTKYRTSLTSEELKLIEQFHEEYFPEKEIIINKEHSVTMYAASYYGTSAVGAAIHRSKYENGGDFPDFLLRLTLKAFHKKLSGKKFDCILHVPPTVSGNLVKNFSMKIGKALNIPVLDILEKTHETAEQKIFRNSYGKAENVKGSFRLKPGNHIRNKRILLLDDIFDSGNTIKEIAKLLFSEGAEDVSPLVIARTIGNDI